MKSFRDLEIYNLSYELAIKIHKMSLKLPKYELFEEGSQIGRSSKGITESYVKLSKKISKFVSYVEKEWK